MHQSPGGQTIGKINVGETNPGAKLQTWQVALIRRVHAERLMSNAELAEEFGIARKTVINICCGYTWKEVKGI